MFNDKKMNIRKFVFDILDTIKGGQINKFVKEISFTNENFDESSLIRKRNLHHILDHAVNTSQFYSRFDSEDIESFPIINKNIIISNFDTFISNNYDSHKLHEMHTSGSTGTPFFVYQDKIKRNRNRADLIYYGSKCNFNIGDRFIYFRVWNKLNIKTPFVAYCQNLIMGDIASLEDRNLNKYLTLLLKNKSIKNILSYASTLDKLSFLCVKKYPNGIDTGLKSIISSSEVLTEAVRKRLVKSFKCAVVSRYSNQENGILAQECVESNNEFHLNFASYFIELLDEDNQPVKPGEMGRVVVTDLFNFGMPIIRYDTGDIATMKSEADCYCKGPVISRIEGRKVDFIYGVNGELLSSYIITNTMWKYDKIRQFQFIQQEKMVYLLKLNLISTSFDPSELLSDLKHYLGKSAIVNIEYVEGIPHLASGKFRNIICEL